MTSYKKATHMGGLLSISGYIGLDNVDSANTAYEYAGHRHLFLEEEKFCGFAESEKHSLISLILLSNRITQAQLQFKPTIMYTNCGFHNGG
jgi:hypothetical protein